nr:heparan-alpha-glucosaminide N-acetyltransferase-like [Nicotiana tomentosiformis]
MAENQPLLRSDDNEVVRESEGTERKSTASARVVSLDVFRGLCVFLMMLVDYAGSVFPSIAHSPWNGVRLADFVMPFFLFVVGVSLAIVNKIVVDRTRTTLKVVIRTLKLFLLGVFLQGNFAHWNL